MVTDLKPSLEKNGSHGSRSIPEVLGSGAYAMPFYRAMIWYEGCILLFKDLLIALITALYREKKANRI